MLEFIIGIFVGAFIGVCFMALFNAASAADDATEKHYNKTDDKR